MITHSDADRAPAQRSTAEAAVLDAYTPVQQHALTRYVRLGQLYRAVVPKLDSSDYRARLMHKALYSTYRDLQELGLAHEARLLRERARA